MNEIIIKVEPSNSLNMLTLDKHYRNYISLLDKTSIRTAKREHIKSKRAAARADTQKSLRVVVKDVLGDNVSWDKTVVRFYEPESCHRSASISTTGTIGIRVFINV